MKTTIVTMCHFSASCANSNSSAVLCSVSLWMKWIYLCDSALVECCYMVVGICGGGLMQW